MPNKFSILNDDDDDIKVIKEDIKVIKEDTDKSTSENIINTPIRNRRQFPIDNLDEIILDSKSKQPISSNNNIDNIDNIGWSSKTTSENKDKSKLLFDNSWTSNNKSKMNPMTYALKTKENIKENIKENTNEITNTDIKKKSFTQPVIQRTETIKLPEYYKIRVGEEQNIYEIPQFEYDWIKRVGALEKANSVGEIWNGIMSCAIAYYENKQFLQRNKFFANKLTTELAFNQSKQDELIELICMQTTAILFHRLVKSDSMEIVKILLKNLPLYKVVPGNPVDMTNLSHSNGANAYLRVRYRYINDLRIIQNKKGVSDIKEINDAVQRTKDIETKWLQYILQSVWNGNNPIHDCLYYGACNSFECLLEHYFKLKMHIELNIMMLEPNIQNETHVDIVKNGKKACEKHSSFIIRNTQFEECEKLYNRTIETLKNYTAGSDMFEEDEIISDSTSDGDNVNVYSLINNGDIDGMIAHINRNKDNQNIIKKTLEIWQSTVDMDKTGQLIDYLDDLKYQTKDIIDKL